MKTLVEQTIEYIKNIGGDGYLIDQILDEVEENGYTNMEQVKAHVENYYL